MWGPWRDWESTGPSKQGEIDQEGAYTDEMEFSLGPTKAEHTGLADA